MCCAWAPVCQPRGRRSAFDRAVLVAPSSAGLLNLRDLEGVQSPLGLELEIVVLGSPSALNVWKQINDIVKPAPLISTIGPTTAEACRQTGLPVWLEGSGESTGLIEKIIARYAILA